MAGEAILSTKPLGFPWETQDPFLFCVYHADSYPKGNDKMGPVDSLKGRNLGNDFTIRDGWRMYHGTEVPGFPAHPHRGFETVTVVRKGLVDHSDSLGAAGRFGHGDVQWMTAGKGVQHSEMFPLVKRDEPNPLELFQIWLNLPRSKKMVDAHFRMLWGDTIPKVSEKDSDGNLSRLEIVAGRFADTLAPAPAPDSWAADPGNEVAIWTIKMDPHAKMSLPDASPGLNRSLYFFHGEKTTVDGVALSSHCALELRSEKEIALENGDVPAELLLLQGKPISEPVAQYGPFVMNDQAEIQQTMLDYQRTEFGGWPWPDHAHVHPRDQKRFAKHADGRLEEKD